MNNAERIFAESILFAFLLIFQSQAARKIAPIKILHEICFWKRQIDPRHVEPEHRMNVRRVSKANDDTTQYGNVAASWWYACRSVVVIARTRTRDLRVNRLLCCFLSSTPSKHRNALTSWQMYNRSANKADFSIMLMLLDIAAKSLRHLFIRKSIKTSCYNFASFVTERNNDSVYSLFLS